ncbi:dephospho-CoA kinase [Ectothiorhodospira lacustris]|uniref:dephospho-CoA kinase n=1 Tax=Ectothiorhodospira lacustris TaxID=2899127 RepID=UPI001EE959DA|nr:dephospho-CoA kinase [Ectothiorhodospira lacustris]MCG5501001.1 dephospho-CoA kinase [Ectothiorhodospira lacustris]MCG5510553.1 dephospho-CoA kinase [Ectothiorhodospira lacustris]MCG5521245.1 dephospho-CoA kinase [Ectothiorhodospira lacustris]
MLTIGLTGGIGSGKSTVSRLFEDRGAAVIDSDIIARRVVEPGSPGLTALVETFGTQILKDDGTLDRAAMRDMVFRNSQTRHRLESLLHPMIWDAIEQEKSKIATPYCVLVVPLLVESGAQGRVDRILLVDCSVPSQRERAGRRDGVSPQQIQAILDAQATREQRLAAADDIIDNEKSVDTLPAQVEALHQRYLRMATAC